MDEGVIRHANGDLTVPARAQSDDGMLIGDGMKRLEKGTPEWQEWRKFLDDLDTEFELYGVMVEDPPFAITREGLEKACRDYDAIADYNRALNSFRKARGISSPEAQSEADIDLGDEQQFKELVALFLNKWQCRLPNPESKYVKPKNRHRVLKRFEKMTHGLHDWWQRYEEILPGCDARLHTAEDAEIEECLELFDALCDVPVADDEKYKRKYSDVAASKTLYVMRPHFFVPWDNAIQDHLVYRGGCGHFYVRYLKRVRDRLKELDEEFKVKGSGEPGSGLAWLLNEIPGQQSCTPVELMSKYYWASVPREKAKRK